MLCLGWIGNLLIEVVLVVGQTHRSQCFDGFQAVHIVIRLRKP